MYKKIQTRPSLAKFGVDSLELEEHKQEVASATKLLRGESPSHEGMTFIG